MSIRQRLSSYLSPSTKANIFSTGSKREGSYEDYKSAYIKDDLVRQCVNLISWFSTQQGFEIKAVPRSDDVDLTNFRGDVSKIREVNETVNLDEKLFMAQVKRMIFGQAGFEIVSGDGLPQRLVPLESDSLSPEFDDDSRLQGFNYTKISDRARGQDIGEYDYSPGEVLWFLYDRLEVDSTGNSAIEPIIDSLETKESMRENMEKAAEKLWAPVHTVQIDTSGMEEDEEREYMRKYKNKIEAGESLVTNKTVDIETTKLTPNLESFVNVMQKLDEDIAGNFAVPKALLSREKTMNRATLEFSLKAMYEGPISANQTYLKRQLEEQWYKPMAKQMGIADEVRIVHNFKPVSMLDFMELADPIAKLIESGVIDQAKAWDVLGWDPSEISRQREAIQTKIGEPWIEREGGEE